jgi:hypothetical protein
MLFMNLALESGTPGVYKPILGTINVETEAIQSTAVSGTGLYLPPIISD